MYVVKQWRLLAGKDFSAGKLTLGIRKQEKSCSLSWRVIIKLIATSSE